MHGDRSSAGDPQPRQRPPYGLPMRRRTTLYEDPGSPAESPSPDALASHRDASILGRNPPLASDVLDFNAAGETLTASRTAG
jgi:hypothetical protein